MRLQVTGTVQGVGFRPHVYRLATGLGLSGFVVNDPAGVTIEAEGAPEALAALRRRLSAEAPRLARIENVIHHDIPVAGGTAFAILHSRAAGPASVPISPDVATCESCSTEIADPAERRYRYPFTNCTDCGPRFTITTGIPYDRPNTTMRAFEMCAECRAEYEDPADRRFHAQPIACPRCGPELSLASTAYEGRVSLHEGADSISSAAALLDQGGIVALKGLGGYHLLCDAADEAAVAELRRRKAREEKPLAVMAPSLEWAARLVDLSPDEAKVMGSWRRPIVLARRRVDAPIAPAVAPGNRYLGVMLSYTPLHQLLLEDFGRPLVATSGNLSDEPIAYRDEDGFRRLEGIADAFVTHNRDIHMRCDDSVVRVFRGAEYPLRRARGYAPEPLLLVARFERPVVGVGAELKHTFCLGFDSRAVLSHHIGDLASYEAMTSFLEGLEHFRRIYGITPEIAAHDLHPDYLSTKWVESLEGVERIGVQHHHAHIASCLADNGRDQPVIGMALDGTGYGTDGTLWGFEVLAADTSGFERLYRLRPLPLPGGAMAIREPWRLGAVYLNAAFGDRASSLDLDFVRATGDDWAPILQMAQRGINSPLASSAGRLFDAAAALCGARLRSAYEGQAAQELEQLADPSVTDAYDCSVAEGEIDGVELIAAAALDLAAGRPRCEVAAAFHNGVAQALGRAAELARAATGLATVALSGGTWQNLLLLERTTGALEGLGFEVLRHRRVPCNDGGISLGQAVVAAARARSSGAFEVHQG